MTKFLKCGIFYFPKLVEVTCAPSTMRLTPIPTSGVLFILFPLKLSRKLWLTFLVDGGKMLIGQLWNLVMKRIDIPLDLFSYKSFHGKHELTWKKSKYCDTFILKRPGIIEAIYNKDAQGTSAVPALSYFSFPSINY